MVRITASPRSCLSPAGPEAGDGAVGLQGENGGVGKTGDAQLLRLGHEPLGVLGAGGGLAEAGEAEAVVDALTKDAAGAVLTFQHHHVVDALLPEPDGRRPGRRARRR